LPHGVFVRGVSGGTLEQVVYYLDILHAFESLGVTVFNNTRSVEKSVDKGMTSFLLRKHKIKTPNTIVSSDIHHIRNKIREGLSGGVKYVLKPIFGSQGKGLQLITSPADIVEYDEFHGVMYAQEFIETGFSVGVDYRAFVIGDRVIASMRREGIDWISNVAQGAKPKAVKLAADIERLAINAMQVLGMDYAGVDLIQDRHGEFWVTEVNSVPAWHGLQQTTSLPIAQLIAEEFLSKC
jgi:RimK family alpha-L-glutamate ligase